MRDVCYHVCCDEKAVPGKPFCALHTAHATGGAPTAKPYYCCHPGCYHDPVDGTELCESHLVMEGPLPCSGCGSTRVASSCYQCPDRPTTEDLATEHDEVLAEVSEALGVWKIRIGKVQMLREAELANREYGDKLTAEAKSYYDLEMEIASQRAICRDEAHAALASLSPEAREQLEARRVVILGDTTYIVDARGDELRLVPCDPWVIS